MRSVVLAAFFAVPVLISAQDGIYKGVGKGGYRGTVAVEVSVQGGKIADVKVTAHKEDRPRNAFTRLRDAMVQHNNYNVDVVSGASYSSRAFVRAVEAALKGAGMDAQFKGNRIKPN